jgi:hypothetical protein
MKRTLSNAINCFFCGIVVFFLFSCKKNNDLIGKDDLPNESNNFSGVYVAGFEHIPIGIFPNNILCKAVLWKDRVATFLGDTTKSCIAKSVYVTNKAVYVLGIEDRKPVVWINEVPMYLDAYPNTDFELTDLKVVNNTIYVLGSENNLLNSVHNVKIWINGKSQIIGNPSKNSRAFSLFVKGNDIYVAGYENDDQLNNSYAVLWKNNRPIYLNQPNSILSQANSVFVDDNNNVFVVGSKREPRTLTGTLFLWKNGLFTNITNGATHAYPDGVYSDATNTYIIGIEDNLYGHNIPAIWKGSIKTSLDSTVGYVTSLFKKDNDIYISGGNPGTAVYWKNEILTSLPVSSYRGNRYSAYASSIFVK